MVSDRAFILHIYMHILWGIGLLKYKSEGHLSRSRSNTKVTVFDKMAFPGALMFHKLFFLPTIHFNTFAQQGLKQPDFASISEHLS